MFAGWPGSRRRSDLINFIRLREDNHGLSMSRPSDGSFVLRFYNNFEGKTICSDRSNRTLDFRE